MTTTSEIDVAAAGILASLGIDAEDAKLEHFVWTETCRRGGQVAGLEPPDGYEPDSPDLFTMTADRAAQFLALAAAVDDLTRRHQQYGFNRRAAKNVLRETSTMHTSDVEEVLDRW